MRNEPAFDADEILEGIRDWVMVESPTDHVAGVNRMMDMAEAMLTALGAKVSREPAGEGYGDVLVARVPGETEGPGVLLLGHLDTVHGVGTLASDLPWRREGDKVFGPGIYDMKGGFYAALYALRQLVRAGGRPRLPVTVMAIPNEEVGSPTTRGRIEEEARAHRYVLVPEPAKEGRLVTGRFAFARFKLHARGRSAHAGATLARGRSAIREMARQILGIEGMGDPERGITYSVGIVQGGTFVNVVPLHAHAEVLAVAPTDEGLAEVRERMMALRPISPDVRLEVEPGPVRPLFKPNDATLALYERAEAIARGIGFVPGHGSYGGGSDGNFTGALGIPTLDGLGLCGDGAHTHEEHVLYSSLVPRARLMAGLLATLD
jgi:glutamate carboxypeptidase